MSIGSRINKAWHKVSRTGLREDEGVLKFREVIFINRMMFITPFVMLVYIPVEIVINGYAMLPPILIFNVLMGIPIIMNHYRKFNLAKYYTISIMILFIVFAGLSVGKGTYNHMAMIAGALLGVILFKPITHRIAVALIISASFAFQQWPTNISHRYWTSRWK